MRILFLTTQLPYPPISGGVIKSWRLVEHWYNTAQVKVICPLKTSDVDHVKDLRFKLPGLELYCPFHDRPRNPFNLFKSYFLSPTLNAYRNKNSAIQEKVRDWSTECDIIFVDHYEMGQYIPHQCQAKVVLHEHNAEFIMWQRMAEIEKNPLIKLILMIEAFRIKKAELRFAKLSDLILAAPNDLDELKKIGVDAYKCQPTYHLGDDFMLKYSDIQFDQTEEALLFIGTLTWEANIDGLLWFLSKVWPLLLKKLPNLKFYIVGKNPDKRIVKSVSGFPNIILTGFVEDLEPYYQKSRVFVIPLRFGSGIKVKLLNALYRGIPSVTTAIGIEGLQIEKGKHLFSTENPAEHAHAVLTLMQQKGIWENMRDAARNKARYYTYDHLLAKHDEELAKLIFPSGDVEEESTRAAV